MSPHIETNHQQELEKRGWIREAIQISHLSFGGGVPKPEVLQEAIKGERGGEMTTVNLEGRHEGKGGKGLLHNNAELVFGWGLS